jgi:hypothetical protein
MADEKKSAKGKAKPPGHAKPARDVALEDAGEVVITPLPAAAKAPEGKQIHPRRPLPLVPTKADPKSEEDESRDCDPDEVR